MRFHQLILDLNFLVFNKCELKFFTNQLILNKFLIECSVIKCCDQNLTILLGWGLMYHKQLLTFDSKQIMFNFNSFIGNYNFLDLLCVYD